MSVPDDIRTIVDAVKGFYLLGEVKDVGVIMSFSGSLALKLTTDTATYIAKVLFRASDIESIELEDEIFDYFELIGRESLHIIKNIKGSLVSNVAAGESDLFVVLYPFIHGKTKVINTVNEKELVSFVVAVANLHDDLATFIPRPNARSATEYLMNKDYTAEFVRLLSENHNLYSAETVEILHSHMSNIERVCACLQDKNNGLQKQIIHADLASSNVLFDGNRVNIIDFGHSGYGSVEWDIAVAIACWVRWQDLYNFGDFMLFFKKAYTNIRPSFNWDNELILQMVQARYYNTLLHSLHHAESERGREAKKYILEDHVYWLAETRQYEKAFVNQTRINLDKNSRSSAT